VSRPLLTRLSYAGIVAAAVLSPVLANPARSSAATLKMSVHGSRGYGITVEGAGDKVSLVASSLAGSAKYEVPGQVTAHGLSARFGRLGKVEVTFRPGQRTKIETPPNRCKGKPRGMHWGAFVGTIRFRGERGFTRVRVRRAAGTVTLHPRWRCRGRHRSGSSPPVTQRSSWADSGVDVVNLDLIDRRHQLKGGVISVGSGNEFSVALFFLEMEERRGRMKIKRSLLEFGGGRDFVADESLSEATLSPSSPFAGKGIFRRKPGGGVSWTGSLSAVLPGSARISLVAPRFRARLYRLQ